MNKRENVDGTFLASEFYLFFVCDFSTVLCMRVISFALLVKPSLFRSTLGQFR